ncbi:hypothetical protein [Microbacterium sp. NPDC089696]|uniref:hypothetical protein n=1 Tax=Microbacterium sp. NPDC089696 TaxID=3364199 RepID=UPI0038129C40
MGVDQSETSVPAANAFARRLREAVTARGVSLRRLQQRLRDRGLDISVGALSQWQSGVRRPGGGASADIVRELEDLLGLEEDELAGLITPNRRVTADDNVPFAHLIGLDVNEVTDEGDFRQLSERAATLMTWVDEHGRIARNVLRNVWQVRVDGIPAVPTFITIEPEETGPPELRPLIGCELTDIVTDTEQRIIRMVLRSRAPMLRGDLLLTEWESVGHEYIDGAMSELQGFGAVRRMSQAGVLVFFHPELLPRRCWVTVQSGDEEQVMQLRLIDGCASHIEFDFGPGTIFIDWEW